MLGHRDEIGSQGWEATLPVPGTGLEEPAPLFKKLDVPEGAV
jgi:hypothetical protein